MRVLTALTLALLVAAPAAAQDHPRDGKRAEMRERIQQKVQTYLTVELSSRLGLDEKKSLKLSQTIREQMEKKKARRQRVRDEAEKLRSLVESKAADAQVKVQLDLVLANAKRDDDIKDMMTQTSSYLTVTEQAKLALAFPEIMKDMRKMMAQAKGGGMGGMKDRMRERGKMRDFEDEE